jgi:apolipoprotein N-acyltransferase
MEESVITKVSNTKKYLLLVLGLLLLMVSNGTWIVPIATWLFSIFIIRFLRTQKKLWHTFICAIAYMGVFCIMWYGLIPFSGFMYYIVAGGIGLILFLPFLVDKIIAPRLPGFIATLIFPLAYVSIEYIAFQLTPYGTWGSLAYTQYGNLPLMQIVSITGIYGLTFLITWLGSVVNWAWEQQFSWSNIKTGIKIFIAVMTTVLLFGGTYLGFLSPKSNDVKIAGVQSSLFKTLSATEPQVELSEINWDSMLSKYRPVIDELFLISESAAKDGSKFVSWAEASVIIHKDDEPAFIDRGKQLAQQEQTYLAMAYSVLLHTDLSLLPEKKMFENKVIIVGPKGEVLLEYLKAIPVPGFEAMAQVKGDGEVTIFNTPYGNVSALICYDNDFPTLVRKVGKAGADILLDPSADWEAINPYHTNIVAFRAIENGFSVVRTTARGLSAAYDYQGRTLATMDYFKTDDLIFTAYVPEKGITTIYAKIGDVFAWLSIIGLIAIPIWILIRKRKSRSVKH